jgi:hypothetical protein
VNEMSNPVLAMWQMIWWWLIPWAAWEAFWDMSGTWCAAQRKAKGWFIAITFVHIFGLVPIYYLWTRKGWPFHSQP